MSRALLTARQVGDLVGVSAETVLRWTRAGDLPAIRLPGTARGRIRYRPEDVDRWLEQHREGAAPPGGVSQPNGDRAQTGGYAAVPSLVSANPPRARGDNPGGS